MQKLHQALFYSTALKRTALSALNTHSFLLPFNFWFCASFWNTLHHFKICITFKTVLMVLPSLFEISTCIWSTKKLVGIGVHVSLRTLWIHKRKNLWVYQFGFDSVLNHTWNTTKFTTTASCSSEGGQRQNVVLGYLNDKEILQ